MTPEEKKPIQFLVQHLFYGVVGALTFGALVLATDLSNIRTMMVNSANPVLVAVLMFFGLIITFGSVAMGAGIMSLAREDENEE
jgi:FtsH-binding integral membrane protein